MDAMTCTFVEYPETEAGRARVLTALELTGPVAAALAEASRSLGDPEERARVVHHALDLIGDALIQTWAGEAPPADVIARARERFEAACFAVDFRGAARVRA